MPSTYLDLFWSFCIGYLFGNFLPAVLIGKVKKKNPFEHGSGNPGMTNTIKTMGLVSGAAVLAGDILKTLFAVVLCQSLFPSVRGLVPLYTGLGCMLGHCYPFWHHFQGGKGVAVVCSAFVLYAPIPGLIALACGAICVLLKSGVKIAAAAIPAAYLILLPFFSPFSWAAYTPAALMGIWMAWLNLRPNRLDNSQPAIQTQPALALKENSPSSADQTLQPASQRREETSPDQVR